MHAFINISGLAIAFSVCILLFLLCYFQFSFDTFHDDKERLFRISLISNPGSGEEGNTNLPLPLKAALEQDIPGIEKVVRVNMGRRENISYQDKNIEQVVLRTDPSFFEIFNFPVLRGDTTPLKELQGIALSEHTAEALFGEQDPIGKQVQIGPESAVQSFTVSAVVKNAPGNSSITFDAVARMETKADYAQTATNWSAGSSNIYIKTEPQTSIPQLEEQLSLVVDKYYAATLAQLKRDHANPEGAEELLVMDLTNMEDVHFSGDKGTPKALIYAIMGIGIFILMIACFNFVNLNIAQSFSRSRELGIRKTLGASRFSIFLQLWGEAFLLYFIGFILGILLTLQLVPIFNSHFDARINPATLVAPGFILIIILIFLLVTLVAGGLPALNLVNFRLVEILKGKVTTGKPGVFRNALIVGQFAISALLISISWIASQQLNHLREIPLGFVAEQVVSIPVGEKDDGRKILKRLRNEFAQNPNVLSITGAGNNLGRGRDRTTSRTTVGIDYQGKHIEADWLLTDYDYLETLSIRLQKGRDFNRAIASDSIHAVVVTESFAKEMGEADPVGKYLGRENGEGGTLIIGVVNTFNAYSPSGGTRPIVMHLSPKQRINYIFVKVSLADYQQTMEMLETAWEKHSSHAAWNASFLDENLQAWYEQEQILTAVFGIASGIAIFLSCLGLFAIALIVIEMRIKEIGIRKVLGASVGTIVRMISAHFLKLILVSLILALPLAWFAMQTWIEGYTYRIELNPLTFLYVALLVSLLALATISFHAIRAALVNPVKTLSAD